MATMKPAPTLPPEIIEHILSYIPPSSQLTFHAAALVSRAWYSTAIEYLYHNPVIIGKNFDLFVRSVCPSINAHVRHNGLAAIIRRLDMSGLVHNGSKSLTARLLGRVKNHLDEFIAPQASFGVNSLAAISKCTRLRCLDLGFVSEAIPMADLLRSIKALDMLVLLYLPRASSYAASKERTAKACTTWPANLREVHLNGGFSEKNLMFLWGLPPSVSDLCIQHCPRPSTDLVKLFFDEKGIQLEHLRVSLPTRRFLNSAIMASISRSCGSLSHLNLNIELLSDSWEDNIADSAPLFFHSIESLEIECLEEHDDEFLDLGLTRLSGMLYDERVPKLRSLLIHRKLRWTSSEARSRQVAEMNNLLKALAREDGMGGRISEDEAGVILFGQR